MYLEASKSLVPGLHMKCSALTFPNIRMMPVMHSVIADRERCPIHVR